MGHRKWDTRHGKCGANISSEVLNYLPHWERQGRQELLDIGKKVGWFPEYESASRRYAPVRFVFLTVYHDAAYSILRRTCTIGLSGLSGSSTSSSRSAGPDGRLAPRSHCATADFSTPKSRANTGWLIRVAARIRRT